MSRTSPPPGDLPSLFGRTDSACGRDLRKRWMMGRVLPAFSASLGLASTSSTAEHERARDPDRRFGPEPGASSHGGQKRSGVFRKLVSWVWA
jgi:hypothetical protein